MTSNLVSQRLSANRQCIQALQIRPNSQRRWRLFVAKNVWTRKDQNLACQPTFDDTNCPDTRRRPPREWLTRRWLKQLTRQNQDHLSVEPASKPLDGDHHRNDPPLPRKLSERCLYPRSEERLAPPRLVHRIPCCSSRVILPNWCNEKKTGSKPHWEWPTKQATNWMHTWYVDNTEEVEILSKVLSRFHVTSTLTRTADKMNCAHSWYTSS